MKNFQANLVHLVLPALFLGSSLCVSPLFNHGTVAAPVLTSAVPAPLSTANVTPAVTSKAHQNI